MIDFFRDSRGDVLQSNQITTPVYMIHSHALFDENDT